MFAINPARWHDPFGFRPGKKYPSRDCAGYDAVTDIMLLSHIIGWEYGGRIYKNPDATYSYTDPVTQEDPHQVDTGLAPLPAGTTQAGTYHTQQAANQPPTVDIGDLENFSDASYKIGAIISYM